MQRTAIAIWTGNLKEGRGNISTQSQVLSNTQYGFNTRFEEGPGTNPEELIAAAHAGCFSMALAAKLTEAGLKIERIQTNAAVTLEKTGDSFSITAVHLNLSAKIPGVELATFESIANDAKTNCPVSKVLKATITLDIKLDN